LHVGKIITTYLLNMAISKEEDYIYVQNPSQFHNFFPQNVTIFLRFFFKKLPWPPCCLELFLFFLGSKMPISHHKKSMLWDFIFSLCGKCLNIPSWI
jgi:hypothetical protein